MGIRKLICALLCLILVLSLGVCAGAEEVTAEGCIQKLISYYFHYREEAALEIEYQLAVLDQLDPKQAATWEKIMDSWRWANEEMELNLGVLPDGLPQDDSLCIVVMGYQLSDTGTMKWELVKRLEVALESAEKYPEAYILCTGGNTGGAVSEAEQMGAWLLEQGVAESRIILEKRAMSTTENAVRSCRLLWRDYPQVESLAIVSTDYHIRWSTVCFQTAAHYGAGYEDRRELKVLGNAAMDTKNGSGDTVYTQACAIADIAGIRFESQWVPKLFDEGDTFVWEKATEPVETTLPQELPAATQEETLAAAEEAAPQQPQEPQEREEPVVPVLLFLAVVMFFVFVPLKRR